MTCPEGFVGNNLIEANNGCPSDFNRSYVFTCIRIRNIMFEIEIQRSFDVSYFVSNFLDIFPFVVYLYRKYLIYTAVSTAFYAASPLINPITSSQFGTKYFQISKLVG